MTKKPFEIPDMMRDMAERNVVQVKEAYKKFNEAAHEAQSTTQNSSGAMTDGVKDIQNLTMKFVEQNFSASFSFATALAGSRDIQEVMKIQQDFAQEQIQNYTTQSQALAKAITKATEKARQKK